MAIFRWGWRIRSGWFVPSPRTPCITWSDVAMDETVPVRLRREQEAMHTPAARRHA
uniref:hypothetical protein n=1 Tax=Bradyrhizobium sp. (strain ORS 278) TaxID=114615 RepID=UPI0002D306C7